MSKKGLIVDRQKIAIRQSLTHVFPNARHLIFLPKILVVELFLLSVLKSVTIYLYILIVKYIAIINMLTFLKFISLSVLELIVDRNSPKD